LTLTFDEAIPPTQDYFRLFETTGWNREYRASPDELMKALAGSQWVMAAYDHGALVGFCRVVTDGVLYAVLYDLIVAPEYQNRGLGTQLLERMVQKCLEANIRDIQLFCAKGKRGFYERRGFKARPTEAPGMQYQRH
jgi:ribosomal protein S18 acetylase RimI-like enzyme